MTTIHPLSSIKPLPEFDIFEIPPTQGNIQQAIWTDHRPVSTLDSKSVIEFNINTALDEYIRLDRTILYLCLKVNLVDKPGAPVKFSDWKNVSTVNNLLPSIFKQIEVFIGDRHVGDPHQTYPYKNDFEKRLGKSKEAKETFLGSEFWFENLPKDPDGLIEIISTLIAPHEKAKEQSEGPEIELMGKLHLPMFEQYKALLGGCKMRIRLVPNDPSFYMMVKSPVELKSVEFTDSVLYTHRSKVHDWVLKGHNRALEKANARYPIRESFVIPVTINKGTQDTIIDNIHNGQLPKRAFVAFVDHSAFNGTLSKSPYNYKHFDLNHLAFYLNGRQFPEKPFSPNFSTNKYLRSYMSMFEATNQDRMDSCITITRNDYPNGNVIHGVNFNPDLSSGCCASGHVNPINFGSLRMQVRFQKPLEEAITALIYLDYDTVLEIDKDRNPVTRF